MKQNLSYSFHTMPVSPRTRRKGMAKLALFLLLAAETVFFSTLLSSYLALRVNGAPSPFQGAGLRQLLLPIVNTLVLAVSALSAGIGEGAIRHNRKTVLKVSLWLALGLGLLFIAGQVYEFSSSGMQPSGTTYGGVYLALIGFHALHVIAGVVVLAILQLRAYLKDFHARQFTAVQIGTWFWYYVTAVWVLLFTALYLV